MNSKIYKYQYLQEYKWIILGLWWIKHWFQINFSEGENKQVQPEWRRRWPDPLWPVSLLYWEVWGATRQWRWRRWWQDWWSVKLCNLLMLFFSPKDFEGGKMSLSHPFSHFVCQNLENWLKFLNCARVLFMSGMHIQ